jgi:hypothetical protein
MFNPVLSSSYQYGDQVARQLTASFASPLRHRNYSAKEASPRTAEPIGEKFRKDMKDRAQASGVPLVTSRAGDQP